MTARPIAPMLLLILLFLAPARTAAQPDRNAGRRVDIGGHALFLSCQGRGTPTVVLDNGTGGWSIHWSVVQRELARDHRVCSYDRAGYGRSDAGPGPRTAGRAAAELWRLLDAAGEPGPFVLVGPSFGGWVARIAAAERPDRTAGVLFVDAAHEDQWEALPGARQMVEGGLKANMALAERARAVAIDPATVDISGVEDADAPALRDAMTDPKTYETLVAEFSAVVESARQAGAVRSLGDIPVVVLTAGRSFDWFVPRSPQTAETLDDLNGRWRDLQVRLLGLSTRSRQILSETGVHALVRTDPALVVRAIRELLAFAR